MNQNSTETLDKNILQDYYQALDVITAQYLKVENAKQELKWYKSQQQEAVELAQFAEEFDIDDISSLPETDFNYVSGKNIDRQRINKALKNINKNLDEINKNLEESQKTSETKELTVKSLTSQKKSTLESLRNENLKIVDELHSLDNKIEKLKNEKMFRLVSAVVVAVIVAGLWKSIPVTFLVTSIYLLIILFAI